MLLTSYSLFNITLTLRICITFVSIGFLYFYFPKEKQNKSLATNYQASGNVGRERMSRMGRETRRVGSVPQGGGWQVLKTPINTISSALRIKLIWCRISGWYWLAQMMSKCIHYFLKTHKEFALRTLSAKVGGMYRCFFIILKCDNLLFWWITFE